MEYVLNFFKNGTVQSSMRLVFILITFVVSFGVLGIDIAFFINIAKYSGTDIALVIGSNASLLVAVIFGKNSSKKIEEASKTE